MIDPSSEANLGRFEWVVCWKVNVKEEDAPAVGGVIRPHDCSLPMKQVVPNWARRAVGGRIVPKLLQLTSDALQCHCVSVNSVVPELFYRDFREGKLKGRLKEKKPRNFNQVYTLEDWLSNFTLTWPSLA